MKKIFSLIGFIAAIFIVCSCEKNVQDPTYTGQSAVFLKGPLTGNPLGTSGAYTYSEVNFSFATYPSVKKDTIINLKAQVVGGVVNYDRKFEVVVDSMSSVLDGEYEFISDFVIPANSFEGNLGVKIKKSRRLSLTTAKLIVRVVENKDFLVNKNIKTLSMANPNITLVTSFVITWTNQLVKPALWNAQFGMDNFVGGYTKVKHQLIIDLTPYGATFESFQSNPAATTQRSQIQSILQNYVAKYNAEHTTPLMNEDNITPVVIDRQSIPR